MYAAMASPVTFSARSSPSRPDIQGRKVSVRGARRASRAVAAASYPRRVRVRATVAAVDSPAISEGVAPFDTNRSCGEFEASISVTAATDDSRDAVIRFATDGTVHGALVLHWAVLRGEENSDWHLAPQAVALPQNSRPFGDNIATRSPLHGGVAEIRMPPSLWNENSPERISAVVGILVREGGQDGHSEDEWLHPVDGGPLRAPIVSAAEAAAPKGSKLADKLAKIEREGGMNNFRRYCLALEAIAPGGEAQPSDSSAAAVLYAHIKLAESRALPLYEGHNYQGKDMVHQAENLSTQTALRAASADRSESSRLYRRMLAQLPRGGGGGDDIRMGILNIFRENGIKEGHRPGIECSFLAQWHQKLHSCTTPDDVGICESYLNFLRGGGDWDGDFYGHLHYHAGLTREDLAQMKVGWKNESGIVGPACHLPFLIPAFEWFLGVLKTTHSGAQMDDALGHARWTMDDSLQWEMDDLLQNRDAYWVPGKIVELRRRLQHSWLGTEDRYLARDALMFDVALEEHFRRRVEGTDVDALSPGDAAELLKLCLQNGAVASSGPALCQASDLWARVIESAGEDCWNDVEWLKLALAALDSVKLSLEKEMDAFAAAVQAPAEVLGKAGRAADSYILNFGEECVRGHPMFVCSRLLQRLERAAREGSGKGPWTAVSVGVMNGIAQGAPLIAELASLQGASGASVVAEAAGAAGGVVLLSEGLDGLEDVPPGVTAVISRSDVDLLSHLALRARQSGALLACCSDEDVWKSVLDSVKAQGGSTVCVTLDASRGHVSFDAAADTETLASVGKPATSINTKVPARSIQAVSATEAWAIGPSGFVPGIVGGKSSSLALLSKIATEVAASTGVNVQVPPCVALPFGAFERVLAAEDNLTTRKALEVAVKKLEAAGNDRDATRLALAEARAAVEQLRLPGGLIAEVRETAVAASAHGIVAACDASNEPLWWPEVRRVWASKWNERAHTSRVRMGIPEADLRMAVLLMELVPAQYSFVLHSRNPLAASSSDCEMLGEVVVGLGETLVGNHPGASLRFTASTATGTSAEADISVHSLPSKLEAMMVVQGDEQSLICRSDSNGEDLEDFAGAGLYDSFTTKGAVATLAVDYSNEPLLWDPAFRSAMCHRLAQVAVALERAMGGPQDIEGSIVGDTIHLLQARPQQL
mmetsp:Transcript_11783/g.43062  ORF Transcript_11783/g.43062 Transcript_11783/m.43062 type:complete len:1166 (-) Transcript_11783:1093-4590(-)